MRRFALLLIGVLAVTWFEYEFVPGHTYLQGESQLYLPALERLDTPGYLSRDLVATHTDVAYTIYDEVTLFLHEAGHLTFKSALEGQQMVFRAAGVTGVLLLLLSAGVSDLSAILIAAFISFGAMLWGPGLWAIDPEPVPRAFSLGLIMLATGLLAQQKSLLAGLAGGVALIYDPMMSAPYWGMAGVAFALDRDMRRLLRPALTMLAIFLLLLANLAQLQPGVAEAEALFGKLPGALIGVEQYRTPNAWVTLWNVADIWSYLAIYVCGLWATARSWPTLNRPLRWLLVALPMGGILSLPLSYLALEQLRWRLALHVPPARALVFAVVFSSLACGIAGMRSAGLRRWGEATLWFMVVFAIVVHSRILDLLRVNDGRTFAKALLCVALSLAMVFTGTPLARRRWRFASLLIPVLVAWVAPRVTDIAYVRKENTQSIRQLAKWAETSTWGSSMFLFPDAGRDSDPGIFRGVSRRAVWVDWSSGALVGDSDSVATEWWDRWAHSMEGEFSIGRLQSSLALPIDYYVLHQAHRLAAIRPVFGNSEFVVYDAADLRRSAIPLALAATNAEN